LKAHRSILVLIFWCLLLQNACSTFQAGIYVLTLDYDGKEILRKEDKVKECLERILISPEKYTISAYTRRTLAAHIKRTPLFFHSFYVITSEYTGGGGGIS
jgi:hypothetical protein